VMGRWSDRYIKCMKISIRLRAKKAGQNQAEVEQEKEKAMEERKGNKLKL